MQFVNVDVSTNAPVDTAAMTPGPVSRRTVSQLNNTWRMLDHFRFGRHIRRESDAIRMLLEAGYEALEGKPWNADGEAGEPTTKKAAPGSPRKRPK